MRSLLIAAPTDLVAQFFRDGEAWYRLNPEWEVVSLDKTGDPQRLKVRYERSEREAEYCRPASADFAPGGGMIALAGDPTRTIALTLSPLGETQTRLDWRETFSAPIETARLAELNLWGAAAAGYLAFAARKDRRARLARWLLDRFWLRMTPTARRVGLLIVGMEGLALLLFIAIVIVYRLIG
ncbi:MAG TPA: hypothetical protein DCY89_03000 [Gammaproteobacteria bacterium]|nr:hypothetical protein [Gammaproteobacteria bacterium]